MYEEKEDVKGAFSYHTSHESQVSERKESKQKEKFKVNMPLEQ